MTELSDQALESWLRQADRTLDSTSEAPRGLSDRLQFVARLLAETKPPARSACLLFRDAEGRAQALEIGRELIVGRKPPGGLAISDPILSSQHFRIELHASGAVLEDLRSRNHTYVNGEEVERCEIKDGDVIQAGRQTFAFLDRLAADESRA